MIIADKSAAQRSILQRVLARLGFETLVTADGSQLGLWTEHDVARVVVIDESMFDNEDGTARSLQRAQRYIRVITTHSRVTAKPNLPGVNVIANLAKPLDIKALAVLCDQAIADLERSACMTQVAPILPLLGTSAAVEEVRRKFRHLTRTVFPAVIRGEAGTGADIVAKALHDCGDHQHEPFIGIEAGDLTEARIDALRREVRGGSFYIEEVGDLSADEQTRLLHLLKYDLGDSEHSRKPRLIVSTQRDLRRLVIDGRFRKDLYYRLDVIPLNLPPLRERLHDLPEIVEAVLRLSVRDGLPIKSIEPSALDVMKRYDWPGNLLELQNIMRRVILLDASDRISDDAVAAALAQPMVSPAGASPQNADFWVGSHSENPSVEFFLEDYVSRLLRSGGSFSGSIYDRVMSEIERPLLKQVLAVTRGNKLKAAEMLGLNRNTLRKKLEKLRI